MPLRRKKLDETNQPGYNKNMSNGPSENEMIVFLQAKGAKFDKNFKQWLYPGIRGYFPTFRMYKIVKEAVDKK